MTNIPQAERELTEEEQRARQEQLFLQGVEYLWSDIHGRLRDWALDKNDAFNQDFPINAGLGVETEWDVIGTVHGMLQEKLDSTEVLDGIIDFQGKKLHIGALYSEIDGELRPYHVIYSSDETTIQRLCRPGQT